MNFERKKVGDVEGMGREKRERIGERDEEERGKKRKRGVAERGRMESFSHRPVAGAPRVGEKRRSRGKEGGESEDGEKKERELVKGTRKRGAKRGSGVWQREDAWRVFPPAGGRRSPRRGKKRRSRQKRK